MYKPKYLTRLKQIPQLSEEEREHLNEVTERFAFRSNEYYNSLINWDDPEDPIRRIVIPEMQELEEWGELDASCESHYKKVPGLEHKYDHIALLLVNDVCGAYCRFCFRKRLFMNGNDETTRDVSPGIEYIRNHPKINNVLLTGGDPLLLSTKKLENVIRQLREIKHVRIIRIGSKLPVFNPWRIINDPELAEMLGKYSYSDHKIYVMNHFNHPRELTRESRKAVSMLQEAGVITVNQTPLIAGVNDDANVLAELFNELSYSGIAPYYVFICRPTLGNYSYAVPVEEAYEIFEQARMHCSGLAKRARMAMSHFTGKIEIVGLTDSHIFMRYHRAANPEQKGRFMIYERNPEAYWFDDYRNQVDDTCWNDDLRMATSF